jgi:hypothetical protein
MRRKPLLLPFSSVTSQYSLMARSASGMPFMSPLAINRRKIPKQTSRWAYREIWVRGRPVAPHRIASVVIHQRPRQEHSGQPPRHSRTVGDKRIALMHSQALQGIINKKTPAAQRNFGKAMRGFIDHCVSLKMITVDPLAPRR